MREFMRVEPELRKNDMMTSVVKRTFIKMTTAKGNVLYAFILMLICTFFYNIFIQATSIIDDNIIRMFRYIIPVYGILISAYFLRILGTEYPVYRGSNITRALKDVFFSWETLYLTLPITAGIVYQCILHSSGVGFSAKSLFSFLILMFFESRIEEYCYRGMFAEALIIRYRESSKGVLGAIAINGVVCGSISLAVYMLFYKFTFTPLTLISLIICECVFAFLYYKKSNIHTNAIFKFLYKIMIFLPSAIFGVSIKNTDADIMFHMMLWFYPYLFILVNYLKPFLGKISEFQSSRVIKNYAIYGIMYYSSKKDKNNYGFKRFLDKWNTFSEDETPSIFMYCLYTVLCAGLVYVTYFLLDFKYDFGKVSIIANNGLELLMAQLSTTFLIVSFLSFLTAKDDYILWQDAMSLKFIYPKYTNFVAFSVYAFASFVFTALFYVLGIHLLVITFFAIGSTILAMLTFKMIIIFFSRRRLLVELELMFGNSLKEEKDAILSQLYQNTVLVINENNCSKIEENFYFLLRLYFVYKRQMISIKHSLYINKDNRKKILVNLVPDEYKHLRLRLILDKYVYDENTLKNHPYFFNTYTEDDVTYLHDRIESELTCFVSLLLEKNPIMLTNLLGEYAGKIIEIEGVREEIKNFIEHSIHTDSNSLAIQKLFKIVLRKNLSVLSVSENELPFVKSVDNRVDSDDNAVIRMYDSNKSFYDRLAQRYAKIKTNYPDEYKKCYDGLMGELQKSYDIMESLCADLEYVEKCDDKLIAEEYRVWKIFLEIQKKHFETKLAKDRKKQFETEKQSAL